MSGDSGDRESIGLVDAIDQVRHELAVAEARGRDHDWRFTVERVNLEFTVQLHRAGDGKAALRLGVVSADMGGAVHKDTTHRIQIELLPHGDSGHRPVSRGD
jgi:NTP-dependent ternary system trypsin peptidase co-occuring protein